MIIFDAKAVMHHSYNIGKDPDAILSDLGNDINTAEYGFNEFMKRYMLPILEIDAPIDILIAHDSGIAYREAIYPEYKKGKSRTEADPEKRKQQALMLDMMKRFWAALGCTQAKVEGVEADDLIAYFCQKLPGNHDVYTVDVDLMQLQADHDNVNVLLKCEYQTTGEHKEIPYKYTSFSKSLLGDASDNYGGIKGFGPAKWKDLVNDFDYSGIDELIECVNTRDYTLIEEVLADGPNKALQLIYDNRDQWRKGWKLAQLHPELCWKPTRNKLTHIEWFKRIPNSGQVIKVLNVMGCGDLADHEAIKKWLPTQWLMTPDEVDEDLFTEFTAECKNSPVIAFDYETYPSQNAMTTDPKGKAFVDVKEALIAGASFTFGENLQHTFYVPIKHKDTENLELSTLRRLLLIADSDSQLVVQNSSFELAVTKTNLDVWLGGLVDTAIMQSYVDENEEMGLKAMSSRLLGYIQASYKDTVYLESEDRMRTMDELTGDEVVAYGCDDAIVTAHLWVLFSKILHIEGTYDFLMENETLSQHSLVDGYLKGCPIDWEALEAQTKEDDQTIVDNLVKLRVLLTDNCTSPNEASAKAFVGEQMTYIKAKAKEAAKKKIDKELCDYTEDDHIAVTDAALKASTGAYDKALRASMYEDYSSYVEAIVFIPTLGGLNEVIKAIGFEDDEMLSSVSKKAISEWLSEFSEFDLEAISEASARSKDQTMFIGLLGECLHQLKAREGDEYVRFIDFCQAHRSKVGKTVYQGDELNTGSPIQMQHLIYCKLGFPIRLTNMVIKGSSRDTLGIRYGSPQTDALAMDTALAEDTVEGDWRRDAVECIKAIKEAKTRVSLYHTPYPLWMHPSDGRLHPQIRNCGTVTRRPSGKSPNVLQVSKHQKKGVMRSIFLPQNEGDLIISIDFSQQELRIMASECGDANLISCYLGDNQRDVHSMTASGIAKTSYENYMEAYKDEDSDLHEEYVTIRKRPAKATNFLLAYMGTSATLSQRLIIPMDEADEMMNSAYDTYPGIVPWQESVVSFAKGNGYAPTAYGSRRHATNDLFSTDGGVSKRMQRQLVNAEIQGCAADILKVVLTNCWKTHLWEETDSVLLAPVYDELVSSVPAKHAVEYINRLVEIMEISPPGHVVPMKADVSLGINWRDQVEIGLNPTAETITEAVNKALGDAQ